MLHGVVNRLRIDGKDGVAGSTSVSPPPAAHMKPLGQRSALRQPIGAACYRILGVGLMVPGGTRRLPQRRMIIGDTAATVRDGRGAAGAQGDLAEGGSRAWEQPDDYPGRSDWGRWTAWPSGPCGRDGASAWSSGAEPAASIAWSGTAASAPAPRTPLTAAPSSRSAPSPRCSPGCCWPTWPSRASSALTIRWPATCHPRCGCRPVGSARSPWVTWPAMPVGCPATPRAHWAGGSATGTTPTPGSRSRSCTRAWPEPGCGAGRASGSGTPTWAAACWARRWPARPDSPTRSWCASGSAGRWAWPTP